MKLKIQGFQIVDFHVPNNDGFYTLQLPKHAVFMNRASMYAGGVIVYYKVQKDIPLLRDGRIDVFKVLAPDEEIPPNSVLVDILYESMRNPEGNIVLVTCPLYKFEDKIVPGILRDLDEFRKTKDEVIDKLFNKEEEKEEEKPKAPVIDIISR